MPLKLKEIRINLIIIRKLLSHDITLAISVGLCALFLSLKVFQESLNLLTLNTIPLAGDGLLIGIYIKLALQTSWFDLLFQNVTSTNLGWPGSIDFSSFPVGSTLEMLLIKAYGHTFNVSDPGQIIHFFSIFKSFLISFIMYFLARTIGIKKLISCFIALTFALSSYNLIRAEGHFLLGQTWSIPLMLISIFLAYKLGNKGILFEKKNILILISTAVIASISSFYYSFFLILFNLGVLIMIWMSAHKNLLKMNITSISDFYNKAKYSLLVLLIQILGIFFQILPIFITRRSLQSLSGVGDRSSTEFLIYSGSLESLFFDLNKTGLSLIKRPDLINLIQTRISWEGSQVGLIPGVVLIMIILFLVYQLFLFIFEIPPSRRFLEVFRLPSARLLILFLFISLFLYFPSYGNLIIAQIFPQIRAWGRLSVFIALFALLLLGIFLSVNFVQSRFVLITLVVLVLSAGYELSIFSKSRLSSSVLSNISRENNRNFKIVFDDLESIYEPGCPIVNLPLYPFPEFDRSDDFNSDYSFLELPIRDDGVFKWSYGGIKATENFRQWQSLISEFPPFNRASIKHQINRGYLSGACGVIVDKTYLIEQEKKDLADLIKNNIYACSKNLSGFKFEQENRYISIQFNSKGCKPEASHISNDEIQDYQNSQRVLWRFDTGSSQGFNGIRHVFDTQSPVLFRFYLPKNVQNYDLRIQLFGQKLDSVDLCLQSDHFRKLICSVQKLDSDNIGLFNIPDEILKLGVNKFSMSLKIMPENEILGWSVTPISTSK